MKMNFDCWVHVLHFLRPYDLCQLTLVSKDFYNVLAEVDGIIWRDLAETGFGIYPRPVFPEARLWKKHFQRCSFKDSQRLQKIAVKTFTVGPKK